MCGLQEKPLVGMPPGMGGISAWLSSRILWSKQCSSASLEAEGGRRLLAAEGRVGLEAAGGVSAEGGAAGLRAARRRRGRRGRFLPRSLGERGPAQPLGADRRGRKLHFAVPGYQARGGLCRSSRNLRQGCRMARGRLHGVSAEGCRVPLNQSLHFWSHCPEAAPSSGPFLIVSFEIQGPRGCPSSHSETPEESVFVTRLAV